MVCLKHILLLCSSEGRMSNKMSKGSPVNIKGVKGYQQWSFSFSLYVMKEDRSQLKTLLKKSVINSQFLLLLHYFQSVSNLAQLEEHVCYNLRCWVIWATNPERWLILPQLTWERKIFKRSNWKTSFSNTKKVFSHSGCFQVETL